MNSAGDSDLPRLDELHWAFWHTANAVMLLDCDGRVTHANPAARALAAHALDGASAQALIATLPEDALQRARDEGFWAGEVRLINGIELEFMLQDSHAGGHGFAMATVGDVSARNARQIEIQQRHDELQAAHRRLAGAQEQLLQSEKMASIGLLAAGVAHEINNPIGYVHSNLGTLQEYIGALLALLECHEEVLQSPDPAQRREEVRARRERLDVDFIVGDLPNLMRESREGIERVTKIVQDLKEFSHVGAGEAMRPSDLHKGLESTLNIVWNDLKYKVRLEKHYMPLPPVECRLSEINQVFMTLLVNAGQAIDTSGTIDITTGTEGDSAWVAITDTGSGMTPDVQQRIFDPFFTTKAIGRGTGLGLAIAYGIVAKHHGRIEVRSEPGVGSTFRVVLPVRQPAAVANQ